MDNENSNRFADELVRLIQKEPKVVIQLKINDLLPPERKDKIKYATPYRINQRVLLAFEPEISQLLQDLQN